MARKKTKGNTFDVGSKLTNIRTLVATQRPKEAIAYMYMLYTMICQAKFKEPKKPSQSIRDYALVMIQRHSQNPATLLNFIQSVEATIYGGRQPSQDVYQQVMESFGVVFREITGKTLPKL